MIWAVVGLAVIAAGLAVAVALVSRARAGDKDALIAAERRAGEADKRADVAVSERNGFAELLAKERDVTKTQAARVVDLEAHVADLSAKLVRLTAKAVATTPVGDEGAALVNDLFSTPILPPEKP